MSVTSTNWMPRRESTSVKSINSLRSAPGAGAGQGPRGCLSGERSEINQQAARLVGWVVALKTPGGGGGQKGRASSCL